MSIRNPLAAELARLSADETGETMTPAVITALRERVDRPHDPPHAQKVLGETMAMPRHCGQLPELDARPEDEILGYGVRTHLPNSPGNSSRPKEPTLP